MSFTRSSSDSLDHGAEEEGTCGSNAVHRGTRRSDDVRAETEAVENASSLTSLTHEGVGAAPDALESVKAYYVSIITDRDAEISRLRRQNAELIARLALAQPNYVLYAAVGITCQSQSDDNAPPCDNTLADNDPLALASEENVSIGEKRAPEGNRRGRPCKKKSAKREAPPTHL